MQGTDGKPPYTRDIIPLIFHLNGREITHIFQMDDEEIHHKVKEFCERISSLNTDVVCPIPKK